VKKSQVMILGAVLISGIVMAVVSATVMWGKPLIDKTTDKVHVTEIINKIAEIDRIVRHVAKTESSGSVDLTLENDERITIVGRELVYKTVTRVPVIASAEWVPLNVLPFQKEIFSVNTSNICGNCPGYNSHSGTIYYGSQELEGTTYYLRVYDGNEDGEYETVCFVTSLTAEPKSGACIKENQKYKPSLVRYDIRFIDTGGTEVIFLGNETENIGILGKDEAGIVIGKTMPGKTANEVMIKLVYRGLLDRQGITHEYILDCDKNCVASKGRHKLRITFNRIEQTTEVTKIYINLEFE